ncbi:MAG: DegT/DnrJ/EryC1/StrS family aminotransferase [Candidatus Hydrogenedentes bacterium]|nr:DegT/DnrJ/EryC1/StrS family aminotransferase [Candidatus Hydrogenedentota bacterium]
MKVNFVDLVAQYETIKDEVHAELEKVMSTASFVLGKAVTEFEEAFAAYCGTKHCVGVASGADALTLALRALGIGPGDEVITAANTFVATVNAIALVGATPVLVDVSETDYNIDPGLIEQAITGKTKAIMPVHLYGQPAEMDPILEIAKKHNLYVVEDSAQGHGSLYKGRKAGSMGICGCFSFYPGKNLGAYGEGGAVTTDDDKIADTLRMLRNCGQSEKYVHPVVGYNSRLHTMQAAVLKVKLPHLDGWNAKRRHFAGLYAELLADTSLVLPQVKEHVEPVWHLYVVQHDRRDALLKRLAEQQVYCGIHYPIPIHKQGAYNGVRTVPEGAPVSSRVADRILSLPMHPDLTDEQVQYVAEAVRSFDAVPV